MPFDTSLSQENEQRFNNWLQIQSKLRGRNVSQDLENYDLRGYWVNGGYQDAGQRHMPDTYKKPNHPTFSDQFIYHDNKDYIGGHWGDDDSFTPGKTNIDIHGIDKLKDYFKKRESNSKLILSK